MTGPRVLVVGHGRDVESVLGTHRACVVGEPYLRALRQAGAVPVIAWAGTGDPVGLLDVADAALLLGGGDVDPVRFGSDASGDAVDLERDEFEIALVLACRDAGIPLLGMCRGAQAMNVALGGTLRRVTGHRQPTALSSPTHGISLESGSLLGSLLDGGQLSVNSFHRWAVDRPAEGMRVSATAPDGTVEGIESETGWWATGVQWHAEWLPDRGTVELFRGLISSAGRRVGP
jgi:putative glutamine amidotransferase